MNFATTEHTGANMRLHATYLNVGIRTASLRIEELVEFIENDYFEVLWFVLHGMSSSKRVQLVYFIDCAPTLESVCEYRVRLVS